MMFEFAQSKMFRDVVTYILFQYRILCKAHKLEIEKYQIQFKGSSPIVFLEFYLDKQNHLKSLFKKIS
jgi:hypothetical protein